jgi:hypothetical protein
MLIQAKFELIVSFYFTAGIDEQDGQSSLLQVFGWWGTTVWKGREGKAREGKGRQGKGRQGKGREGKGRQGKGREERWDIRRKGGMREGYHTTNHLEWPWQYR